MIGIFEGGAIIVDGWKKIIAHIDIPSIGIQD